MADQANEVETEVQNKLLSGDEFQSILRRIDALGITWTEDLPPLPKPKDLHDQRGLVSNDFNEILSKYQTLPNELSAVIFHTLLNVDLPIDIFGTEEDLAKKVAAVSELIITPSYRQEFFFKRLKIPHFVDIDWDIEIKAFERLVESQPIIPYAIISLTIEQSLRESEETETIIFAIDEKRIQRLIELLEESKANLEKAHGI